MKDEQNETNKNSDNGIGGRGFEEPEKRTGSSGSVMMPINTLSLVRSNYAYFSYLTVPHS